MQCETYKCEDLITVPKKYNQIKEIYLVVILNKESCLNIFYVLQSHIDHILFKINTINLYNISIEWLLMKCQLDGYGPNEYFMKIPLNISIPMDSHHIAKVELETKFKTDINKEVSFFYQIIYDYVSGDDIVIHIEI